MRKLFMIAAAAAVSFSAFGAARLTFEIKGRPVAIAWSPAAFPIRYQVDSAAAAKLPGGADTISRSFESWQNAGGSKVEFASDGVGSPRGGQDSVNTIGINDQLFANSGFLAFTTTWFDENGAVYEADIQVDSSVATDAGRVQALVEHEIGHLLGLDHSAVVSSTMYPFVSGQSLTGLDSDDRTALSMLYPSSGKAVGGRLRGRVNNLDGGVFGAQVVAMNTLGAPVSSALTTHGGDFELEVPAGSYKLYIEPLDGPVHPKNLSGVWRSASTNSVRTEFLREGQWLEVENGQIHDGLVFDASGTASLNPKWIGTFPSGSRDVSLSSTAVTVNAGETVSIAVGGDGLVGGMTEFEVLREGVTRVSDFQYGPNYVWASFRVASDAAAGPAVVLARNGHETAMLTGALRVTAPAVGEGHPPTGRKRPVSGR